LFRVEDFGFGADIMAKAEKSWEERLAGEPDELTVDFVESLSIDKRLYKYDIVGSIAHARMLAEQKLITKDEYNSIKDGLIEISEEQETSYRQKSQRPGRRRYSALDARPDRDSAGQDNAAPKGVR
jgi:hypothetical protein